MAKKKYTEGQENYNNSKVFIPENFVGMGNSNKGFNYNSSWGGRWKDGGKINNISVDDITINRLDSLSNVLRNMQYEHTKKFKETYPDIPVERILDVNQNNKKFSNKSMGNSADSLISIYGDRSIKASPEYINTLNKYNSILQSIGYIPSLEGKNETNLENFGWRAMNYKYTHPDSIPAYKYLEQKTNGDMIRKGAPSKGKYGKKTPASAENGIEMQYYQQGLDFKPKTISKNGSELKKLDDLTNFTNYNIAEDGLTMINPLQSNIFQQNPFQNLNTKTLQPMDIPSNNNSIMDSLGGIGGVSNTAGKLIQGIQQLGAEKKKRKSAEQWSKVSDIVAKAAELKPEQQERKYIRPEDNINTGSEFFPVYGVGTNVLKDGGEIQNTYAPNTLYKNLEYFPLEAEDGISINPWTKGADIASNLITGIGGENAGGDIGGTLGEVAGTAIGGPIGGAIGKVGGKLIGGLIDRNPHKTKLAQEHFNKNIQRIGMGNNIQQQYSSYMEDGGTIKKPQNIVRTDDGKPILDKDGKPVYMPQSGRADVTMAPWEYVMALPENAIGDALFTGAGKLISPLARAIGNKAVPNIYKINPWAERLVDKSASFRIAGKDAYEDFLESGVVRSGKGTPHKIEIGGVEQIVYRPTPFPSFQKGYADKQYLQEGMDNVIFKTKIPTFARGEKNPVTGNTIKGSHYAHRPIDMNTGNVMTEIPAKDVQVFSDKPHWLYGYKELEAGGELKYISNDWLPKTYASLDEYRSGGSLKADYIAPTERALQTYALGGDIQTHWGGKAEPISYNPFLPEEGETVMFKGQTHDESDGKGRSGIGVTFGNNPVEVENNEPAVKLNDGGEENNLVVFGNLQIPKGMLQDKKADGRKFKSYIADLSKTEARQNNLVDNSMKKIDDLNVNTSFDKLKLSSLKANVLGANMKLKEIADKKMNAANLQSAINDTAAEHGLVADDLAKGKITKAKNGKNIALNGIDEYKFNSNMPRTYYPSDELNKEEQEDNYFFKNKVSIESTNKEKNKFDWEKAFDKGLTVASTLLPYFRPSDTEGLDPRQLAGEMYALSHNQLEPVYAQTIQPELLTPYDISLQDMMPRFEAAKRSAANNPAALAQIEAQEQEYKNKVLGEQFRQNQATKANVYAQNRNILNEAKLQNMNILAQQQDKQALAKSNTKAIAKAAISSIADKYLQNKLENKTLGIYENLYNYRFDDRGRAINMNAPYEFNIPTVTSSEPTV